MEASPVLISLGTASRCLSDPKFFEAVPEMVSLRAKLSAVSQLVSKSRCSSCAQRRMQHNFGTDFLRAVSSLSADGIARFKAYLGASRIMLNGMNPATKQYVSRIL
jgi:hypothetical protein